MLAALKLTPSAPDRLTSPSSCTPYVPTSVPTLLRIIAPRPLVSDALRPPRSSEPLVSDIPIRVETTASPKELVELSLVIATAPVTLPTPSNPIVADFIDSS